jgi:hypothetical protein
MSFSIGDWSPGIGDPTFMGWLTVYSYYGAAGLCFLRSIAGRRLKEEWLFWCVVCIAMALLGVVKQFNALTAVTEVGRLIAGSGGWTEQRGAVQVLAMVVLLGVSALALRGVLALSASVVTRHRVTILAGAYLLVFVILRGISWHGLGVILNYEIWGARVNWLAELLGVYGVAVSALIPGRDMRESVSTNNAGKG